MRRTLLSLVVLAACASNPASTSGIADNTVESGNMNFKDFSGVPPLGDRVAYLPTIYADGGAHSVFLYVKATRQDTVTAAVDMTTMSNHPGSPIGAPFPANRWIRAMIPDGTHGLQIFGYRSRDVAGRVEWDHWDTGPRDWSDDDTLVFRCP